MQQNSWQLPNSTWVLMLTWIGAVALCLVAMAKYEFMPTATQVPSRDWPANGQITLKEGHWTLVMFAHPRCPCTRASLAELRNILSSVDTPVQTVVAFYRPRSEDTNWMQSDLWKRADAIPGVQIIDDVAGNLAKLFHASGSGTTCLYDPNGTLRFGGGITAGRGHQGENGGQSQVVAILKASDTENFDSISRADAKLNSWPVYGCSILP